MTEWLRKWWHRRTALRCDPTHIIVAEHGDRCTVQLAPGVLLHCRRVDVQPDDDWLFHDGRWFTIES